MKYLNIGKSPLFPAPRRFRRQVRTSYSVLLVLALLSLYSVLSNLIFASYNTALIASGTVGALGAAAWLHHIGRHTLARFVMLTSVNLAVFLSSFFLPQNSNMSMFLLAFIGLPFIVMSWRENRPMMAYFCALPMVLWIMLMVTNYGNGAYFELDPQITALFGYSHSIMVFAFVMMEFFYYDRVTQNYSRALRRALRAEERANRAKTAFLRSMSHEMRTPLSAVLGAADLLEHHPKATPDIKRLAKIVADSGTDLLSLTEKSMAYARITAGNVDPDLSPADPLSLIDPVIERFRDKIDRKEISVEISKSNHHKVIVDPAMFTEVIAQIFDNALTYTPCQGSVRLQIRDGKSGAVRLMVSDTGPGIPKQNHRAAFKPYERLEQTYGTKSGGGVGLTIARSYVHAMHGEIGLEREPSDGTHVWIEVPAA